MNAIAINAFSGEINQQQTTLINARDLHAYLQVKTAFAHWILRRIEDFGFVKGEDFVIAEPLAKNGNQSTTRVGGWFGESKIDYHITLDMAKELCMVERSEIGRAARRYFIEMEKEHRDAVPAWALAQWAEHQAQLAAAQDLALSSSPFVAEVLRLVRLGLSGSEVAKLLDCGETKVQRYRMRLKAAGLLDGVPVLPNGNAKRKVAVDSRLRGNDELQATLPLSVSGARLSTPSVAV